MDTQEMLAVLLNTTEQQSQITETLLAQLKDQIKELNVATQAAKNATPALQKAAGDAIKGAVIDSLAESSQSATLILEKAVKPILDKLSGVVQAAGEVERNLKKATQSFSWQWAAFASIIGAGLIVSVLAIAWGTVSYQRYQIESLTEHKNTLQADIAKLQSNVDTLEKKGGRIKFERCGQDNRLCIEIAPNQGKGMENFRGSWQDSKSNRSFVIPRGY
jgi:FtsZ-binding cell division protein ZapB